MNKCKFMVAFTSMSLSFVMIVASVNFHVVTHAEVNTIQDEVAAKEALEKTVLHENAFDFGESDDNEDTVLETTVETESTTEEQTKKNTNNKKDTKETSAIEETKEAKETKAEAETTEVVIKETKKKSSKKSKEKEQDECLGTFKVTAYCGCSSCCGNSNGITASGVKATAGRTVAADTSVLPFGTKISINGNTYVVEDRGGAINGNRLDIYFSSHQEALNWGVRYCDVYIVK